MKKLRIAQIAPLWLYNSASKIWRYRKNSVNALWTVWSTKDTRLHSLLRRGLKLKPELISVLISRFSMLTLMV